MHVESLWLDEGYTLLFSRMPFPKLILVGGAHEHPPLYYVVVHLLLSIHDSAFIPRYVSVLSGALSIPLLFLLGQRIFSLWAGVFAALLALFSPFQVWYSQDGRAYETASLFVLLSYLFAWSCVLHPTRRSWLIYGLVTGLALYTEYTTLLVLLPQAILWVTADTPARRALLRAWALTGALFFPWAGTVILDARSIGGTYWIPPPNMNAVTNTWLQFLGLRTPCPSPPCSGSQVPLPFLPGHETALVVFAISAVILATIMASIRRDTPVLVLSAWILLPFVLVLLLASWTSFYLDRVFLDASLGLFLLAGAALGRGMLLALTAPISLAVASVLVAVAATGLGLMWQNPVNPDWRVAASDLATAWRPNQAVAYVPGVLSQVVDAYMPPSFSPQHQLRLWYHAYLDVPGWRQYRSLTDDQLRSMQLSHLARSQSQIWLVSQDYVGLNDTRRWLETHGFYCALSEIYTGDTRLELWNRSPISSFGPVVFDGRSTTWTTSRRASARSGLLQEGRGSTAQSAFSLQPGHAYTVNVEYQGIPPADPHVNVEIYDGTGTLLSGFTDRFGHLLTGYPRTEWYDLPADGAWVREPFGFIAPSGATRALITVSNGWGFSRWRNLTVYMSG